jgi:hypothetical protein
MTKEEMLRKSGLTEEEFRELVSKFRSFLNQLNPAQRAAVDRWLPSAARVAASFGPALSVEEFTANLGAAPGSSSTSIAQQGIGLGAPEPCD